MGDMSERVVYQTADQVAIVGTFESAGHPKGAALLLHMMPTDRTSWGSLQEALAARGISSLAIDLRGHGESTIKDGFHIHYQSFQDREHQESIQDVVSGLRWLQSRGFSSEKVVVVGASIGANLALHVAAEQPIIPAVALLSPGEQYRGIGTYGPAAGLQPTQAMFAAASSGDDQESFYATQEIMRLAPCKEKVFHSFTSSGHGTNLFVTHPTLVQTLANWLSARFS
jgi:alpha-beta hydrolase superfamily lysophospholipase